MFLASALSVCPMATMRFVIKRLMDETVLVLQTASIFICQTGSILFPIYFWCLKVLLFIL